MEFSLHPSLFAQDWNRFVIANGGSFLQSYEWGEFQKKFGRGVSRAIVKKNGTVLLCANIIHYRLPFNKWYWYVPYGPVVGAQDQSQKETVDFFVRQLQSAAPENVIFIKIEPDAGFDVSLLSDALAKSDKDIQATETMIMDLSQTEDELLSKMKQKTRYNIKVALRHEIKIISPDKQGKLDPDIFLSLLSDTAKRNRFRLHPNKYYTDMMELFLGKEIKARAPQYAQRLFFAQYGDQIVAVALVGFFGARATYLHGASSEKHRAAMAPYLLHWEIMRFAKSRGFSEYDFWGITTERTKEQNRKKWDGFSRFKIGFAGGVTEYPGAYDFPLNRLWYTAYGAVRKMRTLWR